MPGVSRRQKQTQEAISKRWRNSNVTDADSWVENLHSPTISNDNNSESDLSHSMSAEDIAAMFEICLGAVSYRNLSVLLYMTLKFFRIDWRSIDAFLGDIKAMRCSTVHSWSKVFLDGDLQEFVRDERGGKHLDGFYDVFPDLEIEAKAFVSDACSRKAADFNVGKLAKFIDDRFREINSMDKAADSLIRSNTSCRLDLTRWGARFEKNGQRPYFEGHERVDVVAHRNQFVGYFLDRKRHYYCVTDGDQPSWEHPTQNPSVLICESVQGDYASNTMRFVPFLLKAMMSQRSEAEIWQISVGFSVKTRRSSAKVVGGAI